MPWLSKSNEILKLILMITIICVIVIGIFWLSTSIYANITENNNDIGLPDFPDIDKAQYLVIIKATGEVLLSNHIKTTLGEKRQEVHCLSGYYQDIRNKYRFVDSEFVLDEWYFGDIVIKRRSE